MADAAGGNGSQPPPHGSTPGASGAGPSTSAAAAAPAQPTPASIPGFMAAALGAGSGVRTAHLQAMASRDIKLPPVPPSLLADVQSLIPKLKAQLLTPETMAEMKRYQAEVSKLDVKDPLFFEKAQKIPKPNLGHSLMPTNLISPELAEKLKQWRNSLPSTGDLPSQQKAQVPQPAPPPQQPAAAAARQVPPARQPVPAKPAKQPRPASAAPAAAPPAAAGASRASPQAKPASGDGPSPQAGGSGGSGGSGGAAGEEEGPPAEVDVICNGQRGTFLVDRQMMVCYCSQCQARAEREGLRRIVVSPSEFERHSGTGHSKKWKYTIRTADNTQTIGAWLASQKLDGRRRAGRSPFAAKQRKAEAEAAEAEASRLVGRTRNKRKPGQGARGVLAGGLEEGEDGPYGEDEDEDEDEEMEDAEAERSSGGAGAAAPAVSPPAPRSAPARGPGAGRQPAAAGGQQEEGQGQPPAKKRRVLRWIRRSTASPEKDEEEEAAAAEEEQEEEGRSRSLAGLQGRGVKVEEQESEEEEEVELAGLPLLLPMQRAARAAEAAAARLAAAAAAGSAVGPRMLSLPPGGRTDPRGGGGGWEAAGLRSPSGKPWLQVDHSHAAHEEEDDHEGTDVRLGPQYQAVPPEYRGPPPALGPSAEAQEPLAALPGPPEAEALALAAGFEKDQAQALPRDATADVWLREVADHVRATVTGRQQRQRKQSRWLQETFDPNAVLGGKALVERQFGEDDARDRFMLGRRSSAQLAGGGMVGGARLAAELEAAVATGAARDASTWFVERYSDGSLGLEVRVALGGVTFAGSLVPVAGGVVPRRGTAAAAAPLSSGGGGRGEAGYPSGLGEGGLLPAASGASSENRQDTPAATGALSLAAGGTVPAAHRGTGGTTAAGLAAAQSSHQLHQEGESRPAAEADGRRAAAELRFQRLEVEGAPAGTKCALCRGDETDDIPEAHRGLGGRSQVGLGPMILARTTAVAHAWLHDQCARWSPEVYDPEGNNRLEGMRDAVRRGRMLRCKYCGEKGATLGCFKRTCRASYHLACARKYNCLLQVEPYLVACPEHVDHLPAPFNVHRPPRGGGTGRGRGRGGRGRGGRHGGGGAAGSDSEDGGGENESADDEDEELEIMAVATEADGGRGSQAAASHAALEGRQRQGRHRLAEEGATGGTQELLAQLSAFASRLDEHQQQLQPAAAGAAAALPVPARVVQAPPADGFPLPASALGGGGGGTPWSRERIVEAALLRAELAAEQAQRTPLLVVNLEGGHFRFRCFHSAEAVTPAVQADADAILVLQGSLVPAAAGWPRTHAFPELPPPRQVSAFTALLLREQWEQLSPEERRHSKQLHDLLLQAQASEQGAELPSQPAQAGGGPAAARPVAVAASAAAEAQQQQALAGGAGGQVASLVGLLTEASRLQQQQQQRGMP